MRLERHASFIDLSKLVQAEYLIAAAVGQDRPIPTHEAVQSAELRDGFASGTKHQVIGIAKQDLDRQRLAVVPASCLLPWPGCRRA